MTFSPLLFHFFLTSAIFPVLGQAGVAGGEGALSVEHWGLLAGFCLAVAIVVLVWAIQLRQQLKQQSRQVLLLNDEQKALREKMRKLVANAGDFIFTTDLRGRFQSINPAGERMTGYSTEEVAEMNLRDLFTTNPEELPAENELEDSLAKNAGELRFEGRLLRHDGSTVWTETSLRLFRERGRRRAILGIARNLNDRKQIEEEVKRAQEAAETDTRAKSQYLANMSHEIRTPMNAVIGMCDLLLGTELDPQQKEFTETIRNGADSLLGVLNSVLDFSRVETAKQRMEVIDFDLRDTMENTIELLSGVAADKGIGLIIFYPPTEPYLLRGDPGQLRQVMLNLLRNAVQYTEKGRVVVRVHAVHETATEARIRFEVEDTGVGISPDIIPRLFHPFRREAFPSMPQVRRFGEAGLGLTVSRQIIEIMGGTYGVTSEPSQGSTFWVELPFQKQVSDPPSPAESRIAETSGRRILLVTGSKLHAQLLDVYTRALGLNRRLARDRDEVLESLQHAAMGGDSYDAIVVDHEPPDLNGFAVIRAVRAEYGMEVAPIVLLSSLALDQSPKELKGLKIAARVAKPVRFDALGQAITRALKIAILQSLPSAAPLDDLPAPREEGPRLRILLAEDNRVNQRVALLLLQKLGHSCDTALNGKEVLQLLETNDYDAILMDCQMPEMDGFECTAEIRQKYAQKDYTIIAVTANAMQGDREKCLAAGMNDYLAKPMRLPALKAALDQVVPVPHSSL